MVKNYYRNEINSKDLLLFHLFISFAVSLNLLSRTGNVLGAKNVPSKMIVIIHAIKKDFGVQSSLSMPRLSNQVASLFNKYISHIGLLPNYMITTHFFLVFFFFLVLSQEHVLLYFDFQIFVSLQ